jgi:hypothetical protein
MIPRPILRRGRPGAPFGRAVATPPHTLAVYGKPAAALLPPDTLAVYGKPAVALSPPVTLAVYGKPFAWAATELS